MRTKDHFIHFIIRIVALFTGRWWLGVMRGFQGAMRAEMWSPQGELVILRYAGYGKGPNLLPVSGAGGPTRFKSAGTIYNNMEVWGNSQPGKENFEGWAIWASATGAFGWGLGKEGAKTGGGRDLTYLAILTESGPPSIMFEMDGNVVGITYGAGVNLGYVSLQGK